MDAASLEHFFSHYGLIVLYIWLFFGIFIVPVPEEVVMLTVGVLISKGIFSVTGGYVVACLGSLSGITFSYLLGHFLGRILVVKYGKWIGITEERFTKVEAFFRYHGRWSLPIGYFIPGTRHIMALVVGTTHFGFKRFMIFTYPAGFVWVVLVVTLGYLAGDYWIKFFHLFATYFYDFVVFLIVLAVVSLFIYWYRHHKKASKK